MIISSETEFKFSAQPRVDDKDCSRHQRPHDSWYHAYDSP